MLDGNMTLLVGMMLLVGMTPLVGMTLPVRRQYDEVDHRVTTNYCRA